MQTIVLQSEETEQDAGLCIHAESQRFIPRYHRLFSFIDKPRIRLVCSPPCELEREGCMGGDRPIDVVLA